MRWTKATGTPLSVPRVSGDDGRAEGGRALHLLNVLQAWQLLQALPPMMPIR
ncbi:hypothetical protein [Pseudomonas chlororaphis]|uniref:hypothetical protein n=1 Tax=Pseudomonas chlororaphis TaxID=587753 RepID=UPI001E42A38E|nr:hypothetical protein [Pseudomonas chlororaphis]